MSQTIRASFVAHTPPRPFTQGNVRTQRIPVVYEVYEKTREPRLVENRTNVIHPEQEIDREDRLEAAEFDAVLVEKAPALAAMARRALLSHRNGLTTPFPE